MREYLFRGFHPDKNGDTEITLNGEKFKGKWIEGCLVYDSQHTSIRDFGFEYHEVLPETVGEYIGILDKNGKKIFANDIINDEDFDYCPCEIVFDENTVAYWGHEIGEADDYGYHGLSDCEWLICGNKFDV